MYPAIHRDDSPPEGLLPSATLTRHCLVRARLWVQTPSYKKRFSKPTENHSHLHANLEANVFLRFGPGSYILSHPDWMQRQVHTAHLGQQPIPHFFPFRLFPTLFTLPLRLEGLASVVQYLTIPQGGSTALLLNRLMVFFCNLL